MKIKLAITILSVLLGLFLSKPLFAQITSTGIAVTSPVKDDGAQDGDIICTYPEGNKRCEAEYDPSMFGVISDQPAASIEDSELADSRLIISSGISTVR